MNSTQLSTFLVLYVSGPCFALDVDQSACGCICKTNENKRRSIAIRILKREIVWRNSWINKEEKREFPIKNHILPFAHTHTIRLPGLGMYSIWPIFSMSAWFSPSQVKKINGSRNLCAWLLVYCRCILSSNGNSSSCMYGSAVQSKMLFNLSRIHGLPSA